MLGSLSLVPVFAAASAGSPASMAVLRVRRRHGQLLVVSCAPVSTADKVFSLAESHAELILKRYSMGSYSVVFTIEMADLFGLYGALVPTARPFPPARAQS